MTDILKDAPAKLRELAKIFERKELSTYLESLAAALEAQPRCEPDNDLLPTPKRTRKFTTIRQPEGPITKKTKIICLCGSTRFTREMMLYSWDQAKKGVIAIGWNVLPDDYFTESHGAEAEGVKEEIDELHKRKIDLSDEVYVLNIGGYVGESTRSEVNYAVAIGKPVIYAEPEGKPKP